MQKKQTDTHTSYIFRLLREAKLCKSLTKMAVAEIRFTNKKNVIAVSKISFYYKLSIIVVATKIDSVIL